jgi:hypothetical protein
MSKLPFIVPEFDLGVRIFRILVIINKLGLNRNQKPMLDIERIAVFDFLVKNPHILNEVLRAEGKENKLDIDDLEIGTIESQFPNIISMLEYGSIKGYLTILVSVNLIEIQVNKDEGIFYVCTEKGKESIGQCESTYSNRIEQRSEVMQSLRNFTTSQLIKKIKPFVKGV